MIARTVSITLTSFRELEPEYGGLRYSAIMSMHGDRRAELEHTELGYLWIQRM